MTTPVGPTPGEREQHALWNQFLQALAQVIQLGQLLEPDNRNMQQPMERAQTLLREIFKSTSPFVFQRQEQNLFINGQRLRSDGPTFLKHMQFMDLLGQRRVGGILFRQALSPEQWKDLVLSVSRYRRDTPTPFEDCSKTLNVRGLVPVVELLPLDAGIRLKQAKAVVPERRAFAARSYVKAMVLLREYIGHLDDPARRGYFHLKLMRAVQDLVTVCQEDGWKYFGLVHTKHFDDYLYNHSVNVAIVSIALGVRMGLKRSLLQELGMAALLHDLGKAFLPADLLRKSGRFTEGDRRLLLRHPRLGVEALLRVKQYNEALLKRIMVICEHHESVKGTGLHLYSRIIAIAEVSDALTSDRPHRPAFRPDAAVKMLIEMAGKRLDRDLVALFVQTFGLFPCGTLVELSSGEWAIVFHPNPDPKLWMSPIARIIRDSSGLPYRTPRQIDLAEEARRGPEQGRYIVRTLDPAELGLNVSGYLFSEAETRMTARFQAPS